ncbi:transcriptional regulator [Serratia sp. OLHL2]|jgi:biofilm regulator BssS|uniref:Biofilm formation regulatory protein BssS n=14 Tax=Enterobacterales TaxID=91347 RepID=A0A240BUH1_SERFI|nr:MULTISPECIES: biofilm formation regulator BssS [Serratia]KAB5494601.1 biofilm formation regulator BssS [Enterobacter sp. RJAL6]KLE37712.1 biofilm formation regulatory protein BssS [Serratia sp. TEL]MDI6932173.1 biofilm formation regulator BssS [Serratia sp. Se-PFBMAAmG]QHI77742.1 biofilm formation regulator BssS [Serratia sp. NGAS9]WIF05008.1 biofilm formation regulator BssS [Serratia sp. B1]SAQ16563.1 biofilm formation regulatory protein BssS [Klebsiella oxytoca]SVK46477.1 biofilm format
MDRNDEVIQTHPLVGWDISTVDVYDAMMIRLHYLSSLDQTPEEAQVDRTLWLTTDVARQLINILEAGIAKIEATDYQDLDRRKH